MKTKFIYLISYVYMAVGVVPSVFAQMNKREKVQIDFEFMSRLKTAGIWDACAKMNIDFDEVFAPLATSTSHCKLP